MPFLECRRCGAGITISAKSCSRCGKSTEPNALEFVHNLSTEFYAMAVVLFTLAAILSLLLGAIL